MKEKFFNKLEALIAEAREFKRRGFDLQEPEEATKQLLLEPLLHALGFTSDSNYTREFKIIGDSVDYLLKSEQPLIFVEAKSLLDKSENLFIGHREQVQRYIRNYRVSPEQVRMEKPVTWIVLTNFAQFHFIRVNEEVPTFSFTLDDLWKRREEFWDLLALENLETGRIEELYEQKHKADLDQRFLADLKRWRLLLVNGFALRNQTRSLDDITLASQQLLNRFLFSRMLETNQLIEWNKLARAYSHYEVFHGGFTEKTFAESLRESLFQEIKFKFNTELFAQPLLCDTLALDNNILAILVGHEPLSPDVAATCGFESGQGELLAFRHLYSYDFSLMSSDVMGAVYEKFLAHKLAQKDGRIIVEDTDELRKKEGIYYTPRYIVDYIVAHTLGEKIKPILAEAKTLLGYKNFKGAYEKICELAQIKVLDPAMGSGSLLNSRLLSFIFPFISNKMVAQSFPRLSVGDIKNLPIAPIDFSKKKEKAKHDKIAALTDERLTAEAKRQKIPLVMGKAVHHKNRTTCNLAHYLQKDFTSAVKEEKLIDDVQRTGFVHEILIDSEGSQITLSAVVANSSGSARASRAAVDASSTATDDEASPETREARVLPILRLTFKDDALRQFIYASLRQFLNENSRKHKWTKGRTPEAIYPLIVNTLEPLVYFSASAGDNLRAIRDLMKSVAEESGSADLAAIESEIKTLDAEIDTRVYELYGLTEDEIKIVEGRTK